MFPSLLTVIMVQKAWMRWSMRAGEGVGRDFYDVKHRRTSGDRAYHVIFCIPFSHTIWNSSCTLHVLSHSLIIQADNKSSKHSSTTYLCTHNALGWKQLCKSDGRQENLNLLVRTLSSCKSSFEGGNSPFCLTILSTSRYRAIALTMIKSMLINKGHVSTYDACTYSDVQISKLGCLMLTTNDHISLFGQTVNFKCANLLSRGMVWISL